MDEKTAFVALSCIEGLGSITIQKLLAHYKTPENIWHSDKGELEAILRSSTIAEAFQRFDPVEFAEKQFVAALKSKSKIILKSDLEYPRCLKDIPDSPFVLYVKGELPNETELPGIAIVGTRKPTNYGIKITAKIARELVDKKVSIISGYALGIDAVAHESAANAGGITLAVLGCGLDCDYPAHNTIMREKITERGALITEFPFFTKPVPWHFPRRNRIVSGLSFAVAVIEAGEKSGALITARAALEQNREIFAVPGNVDSPQSAGTNRLIRDGAHPLLETSDILLLKVPKKNKSQVVQMEMALDEGEHSLLAVMNSEPLHIDIIANKIKISISALMPILLALELKGLIIRHPGMCFSVR